jgi:hypothetical protein
MYIVRETFTARPGKASALATLFKQLAARMPGMTTRVMTDFIADFNTVVMDTEVDDLAAFEKTMQEYASRADVREMLKGYTDMYVTGKREVFRVPCVGTSRCQVS